jgi:hypothetical protein
VKLNANSMPMAKSMVVFYTFVLGTILVFSFATFGLSLGYIKHWKISGSDVGGIESGSKVTFRYDAIFNKFIYLRDLSLGFLSTFTGIYGRATSIEIGDESSRYTIITATHGIGFKVNKTLDFSLLQNSDGVVGYFSGVGAFIGSLLFVPFGEIVGSDERVMENVTDTVKRDSYDTIIGLSPKTVRYTENWLDRSNLTDSTYTVITGQDLETVKSQYVLNQRIIIDDAKVNTFKAIKLDLLVYDLLAAFQELTKMTAFSYIRNICYSVNLLGNDTLTTSYSSVCDCISGETTNETCMCTSLLAKCAAIVDHSIPLCFDNDPAFVYCTSSA